MVYCIGECIKITILWFTQRYTAATGESVLQGYRRLGRSYVWLFLVMTVLTGVVAIAGVSFLTGALVTLILPDAWTHVKIACTIVVVLLSLIVAAGHYHVVDRFTKWLVILLAVATFVALVMAISNGPVGDSIVLGSTLLLILALLLARLMEMRCHRGRG